jgi:hypothetical protein
MESAKMMVKDEDVQQCLHYLKNGEEFTFVIEDELSDEMRQYDEEQNHDIADVHITLTPEWYDLVYCSSHWDPEVLSNELKSFGDEMQKLGSDFISTKFTVVWR